MAFYGFKDLKIFSGSMPPDPPRSSRLRRSQMFPVLLKVARFQFNSPYVGHSALCIFGSCIAYSSNISYLVLLLEVRTPPPPPMKNPGCGPVIDMFSNYDLVSISVDSEKYFAWPFVRVEFF